MLSIEILEGESPCRRSALSIACTGREDIGQTGDLRLSIADAACVQAIRIEYCCC